MCTGSRSRRWPHRVQSWGCPGPPRAHPAPGGGGRGPRGGAGPGRCAGTGRGHARGTRTCLWGTEGAGTGPEGPPDPPSPQGHALSREHSSTASTAGPLSSFPARWSRLMAPFSSRWKSSRCSGPKPGGGTAGQKCRAHQVARGEEGSSGSGPLTRGRGGVEIGRKAVDVAADGDPLVGDPKGAEHRHGAVGRRGRPRQGACRAWGCDRVSQGCPQTPPRLASPAPPALGARAPIPAA